jgi:hypothetical protein
VKKLYLLVEQILSRWHQESGVSAVIGCMICLPVSGIVCIGDGTEGGYDVPHRYGKYISLAIGEGGGERGVGR